MAPIFLFGQISVECLIDEELGQPWCYDCTDASDTVLFTGFRIIHAGVDTTMIEAPWRLKVRRNTDEWIFFDYRDEVKFGHVDSLTDFATIDELIDYVQDCQTFTVIYGGGDSTTTVGWQDTMYVTYPDPGGGGGPSDTTYSWPLSVNSGTPDTIVNLELVNLVAGTNITITQGTTNITFDADDDQQVDLFDIMTNTIRLDIENDGQPIHTVDLTPYLDNTDSNVDSVKIIGTTLYVYEEGDSVGTDLVQFVDTDSQNIFLDMGDGLIWLSRSADTVHIALPWVTEFDSTHLPLGGDVNELLGGIWRTGWVNIGDNYRRGNSWLTVNVPQGNQSVAVATFHMDSVDSYPHILIQNHDVGWNLGQKDLTKRFQIQLNDRNGEADSTYFEVDTSGQMFFTRYPTHFSLNDAVDSVTNVLIVGGSGRIWKLSYFDLADSLQTAGVIPKRKPWHIAFYSSDSIYNDTASWDTLILMNDLVRWLYMNDSLNAVAIGKGARVDNLNNSSFGAYAFPFQADTITEAIANTQIDTVNEVITGLTTYIAHLADLGYSQGDNLMIGFSLVSGQMPFVDSAIYMAEGQHLFNIASASTLRPVYFEFDSVETGSYELVANQFLTNSTALGAHSIVDRNRQVALGDTLLEEVKFAKEIRFDADTNFTHNQFYRFDSTTQQLHPFWWDLEDNGVVFWKDGDFRTRQEHFNFDSASNVGINGLPVANPWRLSVYGGLAVVEDPTSLGRAQIRMGDTTLSDWFWFTEVDDDSYEIRSYNKNAINPNFQIDTAGQFWYPFYAGTTFEKTNLSGQVDKILLTDGSGDVWNIRLDSLAEQLSVAASFDSLGRNGTPGQIVFETATKAPNSVPELFWKDDTDDLGIGTNAPDVDMHISKAGVIQMDLESTDDNATQIRLRSDATTNRRINGRGSDNVADVQINLGETAINLYGVTTSTNIAQFNTSGQWQMPFYTAAGSFPITETAILGTDASGNVGTIDPSSISPSLGNKLVGYGTGTSITGEAGFEYDAALNRLSIPTDILVGSGSGNIGVFAGFNRSGSGDVYYGMYADAGASIDASVIRRSGANGNYEFNNNGSGSTIFKTANTDRLTLLSTGQLRFNAYTSALSFSETDVGMLSFASNGDVGTMSFSDVNTALGSPDNYSSWTIAASAGSPATVGSGQTASILAGGGISTGISGRTVTITNTGDLSTSNEIQTISSSGATVSLSLGGGSTNLTEAIQDVVGGMVSGNTESGITVAYQDGDGTLDFTVTGGSSEWTDGGGFLRPADGSTEDVVIGNTSQYSTADELEVYQDFATLAVIGTSTSTGTATSDIRLINTNMNTTSEIMARIQAYRVSNEGRMVLSYYEGNTQWSFLQGGVTETFLRGDNVYIGNRSQTSDELVINSTSTEANIGHEGHGSSKMRFYDTGSIEIDAGGSGDDLELDAADIITIRPGSYTINIGEFGVNRDPSTDIFEVAGDAGKTVGGADWNTISDQRIKKNITEINRDTALAKFRQLKPSMYMYTDYWMTEAGADSVYYYSYIAQEVESVLPEAVREINEYLPGDPNKIKQLQNDIISSYQAAALIENIDRQEANSDLIDDLMNRVEALEAILFPASLQSLPEDKKEQIRYHYLEMGKLLKIKD